MLRKIVVPLPVFLMLCVGILILGVQGLRMARDRSARLQPAAVAGWIPVACEDLADPPTPRISRREGRRALILERACPESTRLALLQEFPERRVLRWLEPKASRGPLILPLEGLEAGIYRLVAVDSETRSEAREMDAPPESAAARARFLLVDDGL